MIHTAKIFCQVDSVKFQKRAPKELLSEEQYNSPHPNQRHAYGSTYGEHREFLEFTLEQHRTLKAYCDSIGIIYSSSVWDLTSAKEIVSLNPTYIKIPSACNTHYPMLEYLCDEYRGEIHISLGMTTKLEEETLMAFLKKKNRSKDVVLYACTSGYPVLDEDVCLLEITNLKNRYAKDVKAIGFSGHHNGICIDTAAYVVGAEYIERHFTLDRTWKGTDHAASLEPDGMRRIARDTKVVFKTLTFRSKEILDVEVEQRQKLKWKSKNLT
jgi:N-acetylneuraminate synthase